MIFRFDAYQLDDEQRKLLRGGSPIELQSKVYAVLAHLVANSSRISTKDELLRDVWPDVEVSEASLTRCISLVRKSLGEAEGEPRIIQTIRGRGYGMGVPVTVVASAVDPPGTEARKNGPPPEPGGHRRRAAAAVGATLGIAFLATWLARPYADLGPGFRSRPPTSLPETAIAVLPFSSDSNSPPQTRLARALASELVDQLGMLPDLQVTPLEVSLQLGSAGESDLRRVGKTLRSGRLLSGRLQVAGDEVRVAIELIDARTGFVRWSDVYPARWGEVGNLPQRISGEVVRAVTRTLPIGVGAVVEPTAVAAARYSVEGRIGVLAGTRESLATAARSYEQAIALDPSDVRNHVALAIAYDGLWNLGPSGLGWLERGEAAAERAVELAPASVDALMARATLRRARRDWQGAMADFERAIELGGSAEAYEGLANLYSILGRPRDGLEPASRAVELAPLRPSPHRTLGRIWFFLGNEPLAISYFQRSVGLRPESAMIVGTLATAFERNGQPDEAAEVLTQGLPPWLRPLSRIHMRLAGEDASLRITMALDRLTAGKRCGHDSLESAMVWARIGDRDWLLECLEQASRDFLWYLASEPIFDPYRADPEFRRIVLDAGFPVGQGPEARIAGAASD